jgi:hypothetical protein
MHLSANSKGTSKMLCADRVPITGELMWTTMRNDADQWRTRALMLNLAASAKTMGPPETINSLEYLKSIYRDPNQSISTRMRAAIEALPFENAKLSAIACGSLNGQDFASLLDRAIERSKANLVIEHEQRLEFSRDRPA